MFLLLKIFSNNKIFHINMQNTYSGAADDGKEYSEN